MSVPADQKFSGFIDGGTLVHDDIVVGLRNGLNTRFSYQGDVGIYLPLAGGTMSGAIIMDGNAVTDLPSPTNPSDAATKAYVDSIVGNYLPLAGGTMSGSIDMGNNFISNMAGIKGANGNVVAKFIDTVAGVNSIEFQTGLINEPTLIDAAGDDVNITLNLRTKAADFWFSDKTGTRAPYICWFNDIGKQYVGFRAPPALTTSINFTWPGVDGSAGYVMTTDGAGNLSFAATAAPASAALTKADDTNVTLTLGGSPSTALLHAASITAGWTGTLAETRGGTNQSTYTLGDTLYASAANTLSKLAGNTTAVKQYLSQTGTGAVSAAPAWATIAGGDITGAALTKTDDTNVTMSLGGTPTTALLRAASMTLGWTGTLSGTRGGTGVNNGSNTATFAGNLNFANAFTTSGNFAVTQTYTGITNVTFPTSGTLATTSQIPTGAALTKSDDTNVTLTLGGSPTTALVNAASLTLGWTGQLGLTRGGTNASLTASNGGIVYSTASAMAILAGTATAQQLLLSGASTTPQWSTTTYPLTNAINTIMYASSANVLGVITPVNSAVMISSSGGVPFMSTTLPSGISATNMALTTPAFTANPTGSVTSGSYTPTISNIANVSASSPTLAQYIRVGSVVTVSGTVSVDAVTTLTITQIRISLPIASNFTATTEGAGVIVSQAQLGAGRIESEGTSDTMQCQWIPTSVANDTYGYTFTYTII